MVGSDIGIDLGTASILVYIKVKGVVTVDKYDSDLSITSIAGIKKIPDFTKKEKILLQKSVWNCTVIQR